MSMSWVISSHSSRKYLGTEYASSTWQNGRPLTVTAVKTRTGTRVPKWRELIASGQDATSNMTAIYDSFHCGIGYWTCDATSISFGGAPTYYVCYGSFPCDNGFLDRKIKTLTVSTSSTDNKARAKFYKALRKQAVQMSGPTFFGELGQTLHMLRRPAQSLWSSANGYLDAVSRAKRASPKNWTKALSGLWLEYSFGWIPLLSDCKDAASAWNAVKNNPRTSFINSSFKDSYDTSNLLGSYDTIGHSCAGGDGIAGHAVGHWTQEVNVRYKAKLRTRAEMTTWDNFALFGFTPSEFVPTAWELLPWSFLVDYFTNIGDILTSVVTDASDVTYVVRTVRTYSRYFGRLSIDLVKMGQDKASYCTGGGNPVDWDLSRKTIDRSKGSSVPLPEFQLSFDLSDGQLGNIAALLGQSRPLHPQNPRFRYRGIPY